MDSMGTILEGDWSCLSGMYATDQEADFMSQLLSNFDDHADQLHGSSSNLIFWPANHASFDHTSGSYGCSSDMNSFCSSQEIYYLSDSHPVFVANDNNNNNSPICMEFCMDQDGTNPTSFLVEADDCLNINVEKGDRRIEEPKRETAMAKPELIFTDKKSNNNAASENSSKKRSRNSGDQVQKTRKNARSKKNQASVSNSIAADNEEDGNAGLNGQSWASCSSEDDSNASQESKGEAAALNLNGKTRASRGAATDPQSLYARKRRERINERLRILQNLVPNGTKVDISTMLEEAVQYVKFLQLQIKLLSSDDHWMYAPIAYNGMDIGLDLKVGAPKRS